VYNRICFLLIGLLLAAGPVLAQGIGFGFGFDDIRVFKAGPAAPASALLINTGNKFLINTGIVLLIQ